MLLLAAAVYDLPTGTVSLCLAVNSAHDCQAFDYAGPTVWNSLPDELRNSDSFDSFKRFIKTIIFSRY